LLHSTNWCRFFLVCLFLCFIVFFRMFVCVAILYSCWLCNWPLAVEFRTLINRELLLLLLLLWLLGKQVFCRSL
jgi:hypothetical protein